MKAPRTLAVGLCLLGIPALPALAQTMPPTTQELQQQHNQAIQNESSTVHNNLNQSIQQTPAPATPTITPRGRIVSHPPGYIPMPNPNR
ncbi:MAG: hypothetical protein ABI450_12595 [Rhizomicrobium sp.]